MTQNPDMIVQIEYIDRQGILHVIEIMPDCIRWLGDEWVLYAYDYEAHADFYYAMNRIQTWSRMYKPEGDKPKGVELK